MNKIIETVNKNFHVPLSPYKYQAEVLEKSESWPCYGCFMAPGTGKTLTSTYKALYETEVYGTERILIIVPPILITQWYYWMSNIRTIDGKPLNVLAYKGTKKQREKMDLETPDVVIVSTDIYKRDNDRFNEVFAGVSTSVILDEAHCIKNPETANYNAVFWAYNHTYGNTLQMLTGTPISKPLDAYSYISLHSPDLYKSYELFELTHVEDFDFYGKPITYRDLDLLHERLYRRAVSVLAEDVLDSLPPISRIIQHYELSLKHERVYKKLMQYQILEYIDEHGEDAVIDATDEARFYNIAQRIIWCPEEFGQNIKKIAGLELIKTLVEQSSDKTIIYANYRRVNRKILDYLNKIGYEAVGLWGDMNASEQDKNLSAFLNEPSVKCLVANPVSGGVGLNLQGVCSNIIFAEFPVVPGRYRQAEARVYRDGQKKHVNVWNCMALNTIQDRIYGNCVQKDAVNSQVVLQANQLGEIFRIK